jgi:hypothetical protein
MDPIVQILTISNWNSQFNKKHQPKDEKYIELHMYVLW